MKDMPPEKQVQKKSKRKGLIIGAVLVVVLALGGAAGWYIWQKSTPASQSETSPPSLNEADFDKVLSETDDAQLQGDTTTEGQANLLIQKIISAGEAKQYDLVIKHGEELLALKGYDSSSRINIFTYMADAYHAKGRLDDEAKMRQKIADYRKEHPSKPVDHGAVL